jgi:hypothetical protein
MRNIFYGHHLGVLDRSLVSIGDYYVHYMALNVPLNHLKAMGLKQSTHSPCLFTGVLVPGEPPIYVGTYVDDIIYFSANDTVESKFEELLSTIGSVDFMGQVSLFLGAEFS